MLKKALWGLFSSLLLAACAFAQNSADISGDWQGTLSASTLKLRIIVRIAKAGSSWSGKFFSIDQSPDWGAGAPLGSIDFQNRNLKFRIPAVNASYEGTLSADGTSISGTFTQDARLPLDLQKPTRDSEWKDPSPHAVQFVTVNRDVKLEVLDWGGTGRPLLLLAGLGNTAHIFDIVAPKLSGSYHVYGLTRRGYGASSVPDSGYSADRLADDVLEAIDFLKLNKPILAGHSIAGQELSSIGSRQPGKVGGLIYLDAGYKYAYYSASASFPLAPTPQQLAGITPTDRAIMEGGQRYTKIQGPVLAIYASLDKTPEKEAQIKAFEEGVPSARVVRLPDSNHYIFLSSEEVVLCEINAFISALSSGPAGTRSVPQCTPSATSSSTVQPPKEHKEIPMDPKQFDTYVGRYQATPEILLTISREGSSFFARLTGQPSFPIFAESPRDFFFKVVDAQLTFQVDPQGRATAVVLHQLGRDQRFPRIEGEPQQAWFGHKENPIDPKVLDGYVGRYQFGPNLVSTLTNENGHLFGQVGPGPKIELFPETERDFFVKVVDTQFTFEVDAQGRATAVIQHVNGKDQRAPRIE